MKLSECYIENFGKLSSYVYKFSDGLNIIKGDNGFGKTTLSVFIKSMLYGIDAKKTRGEESDRKRYHPWQGGRFGGSLTFETEGNRYRIERTFGDKPSGDDFALYNEKDGGISHDFSENVGEELFGIDADGFERTVFLSERKLAVNGSNQTVAAKLSNLVGVDGDMGSFDKAVEKLEKAEKLYQHRRGNGGIIGDIKSEISRLDSELIRLAEKKAKCAEEEKKLSEISKSLTDISKKKRETEDRRSYFEHEKEYLKKREALLECEKEIDKEVAFFGGMPPTRDEVRINEKKKNEALALQHATRLQKETAESAFEDYSEEINTYITAVESSKNSKSVNKSYHFHFIIAIFAAVCAIALGLLITPVCYLVSLLSLPFIYLGTASFKSALSSYNECESAVSVAKLFILEKKGVNLSNEEVYPYLFRMKAELLSKKNEIENAKRTLYITEERIAALTEEYEAFLKRFSVLGDNAFDEILKHISSYESLTALKAKLRRECEAYRDEHRLPDNTVAACTEDAELLTVDELDSKLKELQSARFTAESTLSALYEEIAREDELNERRLELCDALENAKNTHKTVLKATEHLSLAKERLTSKYLGKMRDSFDCYTEEITEENGKSFTIDTNFSLKKTEGGLTNKIESYSLGTRELYSLIARFSLIDALYEKNRPFVILDDPFCHFDDKKCASVLNTMVKIAKGKQIIYLTCSDSRTPN